MAVDAPLYTLHISPARRVLGIASYAFSGLVLPITILSNAASLLWVVLFLAFAGLCLWQAWRMYFAGQHRIELWEDALILGDGTLIAPISEIDRVDRGVFAIKPSGGFTIYLKSKAPAASLAGVFWRRGRYLLIGGITPPAATRGMADMLQALLIRRDSES